MKGWQPVISEGTDWVCVCARDLSRRAVAVAVPISRPHAALSFVSVCVFFSQGYGDVTPVTVYEQATVIPIVGDTAEQRGTASCGSSGLCALSGHPLTPPVTAVLLRALFLCVGSCF